VWPGALRSRPISPSNDATMPKWQAEEHAEGQRRENRQVRVALLPAMTASRRANDVFAKLASPDEYHPPQNITQRRIRFDAANEESTWRTYIGEAWTFYSWVSVSQIAMRQVRPATQVDPNWALLSGSSLEALGVEVAAAYRSHIHVRSFAAKVRLRAPARSSRAFRRVVDDFAIAAAVRSCCRYSIRSGVADSRSVSTTAPRCTPSSLGKAPSPARRARHAKRSANRPPAPRWRHAGRATSVGSSGWRFRGSRLVARCHARLLPIAGPGRLRALQSRTAPMASIPATGVRKAPAHVLEAIRSSPAGLRSDGRLDTQPIRQSGQLQSTPNPYSYRQRRVHPDDKEGRRHRAAGSNDPAATNTPSSTAP